MNNRIINTTADQITARLVVYRDYIQSSGEWRLFWEDINNPGCGFCDESTVMWQPFFRTMRAAVDAGMRKHGIKAIKASW